MVSLEHFGPRVAVQDRSLILRLHGVAKWVGSCNIATRIGWDHAGSSLVALCLQLSPGGADYDKAPDRLLGENGSGNCAA